MQRHPAQLQEPLLRARVQVQPECLVAHRFFQPQRRLARRRRQGDERRGGALGERLLMEQRQQPGHGRGLSRPRPSGDDRDALENGGCSGQRLQVIGILRLRVDLAEQRRQAGAQERQVDVDHVAFGPGQEFCRHPSFVEPEAVQVEVRPRQPERAALPDQRALAQCVEPRLGIGPRQRVEVGRQVDVPAGRLPDGPQVDAHMAEPRRPGGKGDPEGHGFARFALDAGELCQTVRDVDVCAVEDPRPVEGAQAPCRAGGHGRVVAIQADVTVLDDRHRRTPWSKRSLSAVTSPAGGHHDQTPQGVSPKNVGSSALMPRTKR